jgi:O-antigen/teichoic acid export membrane protein
MLSNRRFGGPFLIEFLAAGGANYAGLAVLAVASGIVAVGAVRVGQTVFGPVGIAYQGVFLTLVPEGARHRATDIGQLRQPMVRASIVLGAVAALWTAVLLVIPSSVGRLFFGATWAETRPVLLPLGVAFCGGGVVAGAAAGLRALGAAWPGLRVRLITLPLLIALPIVGAVIGDEVGFCAGIALATWLALGLWWTTFGKALAAPPDMVSDEDVLAAEAGLIAGPQ